MLVYIRMNDEIKTVEQWEIEVQDMIQEANQQHLAEAEYEEAKLLVA